MTRKKEEEMQKVYGFITILLGIAVIATGTAYFILRLMSEKNYRDKWKDYDDCGLA